MTKHGHGHSRAKPPSFETRAPYTKASTKFVRKAELEIKLSFAVAGPAGEQLRMRAEFFILS
jgi:hypothetical protein